MDIKITPVARVEKSHFLDPESWVELIENEPQRFTTLIQEMGKGDTGLTEDLYDAMGEVVRMYPEDFAPSPGMHLPPTARALNSMKQAILNWIRGIKIVEQESRIITKPLPLCIFNSPDLPGAKTIFGESITDKNYFASKVEVLGTGFGDDITIEITNEAQFTSTNGDQKLVFAPLKFRAAKCALYKRGTLQKTFLQSQLDEQRPRESDGSRSLGYAEWIKFISNAQFLDRYDLLGDHSADVAKYKKKIKITGNFEVQIGLTVGDVTATTVAKCSADHVVEAAFDLPPGRAYELWTPISIFGFYFKNNY